MSVLISGMSAMAQTTADTISTPQKYRHKTFFRVVGRTFGRFMSNFSEVDTNYIEPQKFNYTVPWYPQGKAF